MLGQFKIVDILDAETSKDKNIPLVQIKPIQQSERSLKVLETVDKKEDEEDVEPEPTQTPEHTTTGLIKLQIMDKELNTTFREGKHQNTAASNLITVTEATQSTTITVNHRTAETVESTETTAPTDL